MHDLSGNRWYRPGDGGPDQTRCLCSFQVSAAKHRTSSDFFEKTLTLGRACRFSQLVHAPGCKTAALHLLVCGRMLLPTLGPRLERTGFPFLLVRLLVLPQAGQVRLFALVFDIFTYVLLIIYTKPYHTYIHTDVFTCRLIATLTKDRPGGRAGEFPRIPSAFFGFGKRGFRVLRLQVKILDLPLVSREWRNGVQLQLLLAFFHSLLSKGRLMTRLYPLCSCTWGVIKIMGLSGICIIVYSL